MNLPDIFVNLEQSSGLDCTVQDASYNKDGYFPSEIWFYLMKQPEIYFVVLNHFCECATVQSGHLKSPACTRVNLCKIIFPKNKATIINLMTVVIQYANAYSNLKNQDFWCGHLRTDQDCGIPR